MTRHVDPGDVVDPGGVVGPGGVAGPGGVVGPSVVVGLVAVVAAAIVRDGRVLAARRSRPTELAGRWEFPGGKVEPGEDGPAALARECREELGVDIGVGPELGRADGERIVLTLYAAALTAGVPEPGDAHDELRWLTAPALESVDWLPIDAVLLDPVRAVLQEPESRSTV